MTHGLGRRYAPDDRDNRFALAEITPESTRTRRYWWQGGAWLDQGSTSSCVGHAFAHWVADGPVRHSDLEVTGQYALNVYYDAQRVDEWPGEEPTTKGTSVRAGAKVLQAMDLIFEYRWAFDLDTTLNAILELGPVVVGVNWYSGMLTPDAGGFIHVEGSPVGGHALVANGVDLSQGFIRLKNSWSRSWSNIGSGGYCRISLEDFERLLHEDGECCLALEVQG